MSAPRRLRELLHGRDTVVVPGAFDCLSARLIEAAGFPVVYMTGFGTAASYLGQPDVGLLGMSEMADNARRIAQAVQVPVIADADTGYGTATNVIRTVRTYETAGVAGLHIEDQVMPKQCGHMRRKRVIPAREMAAKIRAAVAARASDDFVVIARTDARAVEGLAGALQRARIYRDAGADALFVEAPHSEREVEMIAKSFPEVPLIFNLVDGGRTPPIPLARIRKLGFRIVFVPINLLLTAAGAMAGALATFDDPRVARPQWTPMTFDAFVKFIGLPEVERLRKRA